MSIETLMQHTFRSIDLYRYLKMMFKKNIYERLDAIPLRATDKSSVDVEVIMNNPEKF